jgi:hypothetical protein
MTLCIFQETAELSPRGFCSSYRDELRTENETARRIHQRKAVKVSVTFRSHVRAVEAERYPGFVDFKLLGMEHSRTVLITPNLF